MENSTKSLTILVSSTDSYKDLWPNFFKCKEDFWKDCPFNTVLVNDIEKPDIRGIEIINSGENATWSERMRNALSQISSDYICFILDDFYITNYVDSQEIINAINLMQRNEINYYKLFSLSRFTSPLCQNSDFLHCIPSNYYYGISLTPSIWNREYFLEKIGQGNYNPWKFEADRLKEEKDDDGKIMLGIFDNRNILHLTHMVVQGKYLPPSVEKMKKIGIELNTRERPIMSPLSYRMHKIKGFIGIKTRKYPFLKITLKPILKKYSIIYKNSN